MTPHDEEPDAEHGAAEAAAEQARARLGALRQLHRIGMTNLFPFATWLRDRPWNLALVQWFLFFTLFPLFMVSWAALTDPRFGDVAFIYGIYFATICAVVIYFFIRPERIGVVDIVRVALFTSVIGLVLVGVLQRLPLFSWFYGAARSSSLLGRFSGFVFGVGFVEELVKALPILWIFVRNREPGTTREITFLGCISGFAFGVSEAAAYSLAYLLNLERGVLQFEDYLVVQFTRLITLPLLHAMFAGVAAHFIALAAQHPGSRRGLILLGIATASTMHGLYNTFASTALGFVVAIMAVLVFIAYVRSADAMLEAVRRSYRTHDD